jgi:hypothetical protein
LLLLKELREAAAKANNKSLATVDIIGSDCSLPTFHRSKHYMSVNNFSSCRLFVFEVKIIQLSDDCIVLPNLGFVSPSVVRIHSDLLFELGNLLTLIPHLYDVLKGGMICVTVVNFKNMILILLNGRQFRNLLELVAYNLLQVTRKHGSQQVWVVIIVFLRDRNTWDINTKVFKPDLLLLHVLDGIILSESELHDANCDHESNYTVKANNPDGYILPREGIVNLPYLNGV